MEIQNSNPATIGELLRRERLRQGLELSEIARRTKIQERFLQAIEAGRFEELPGPFFAKSFVRQYMEILGVRDPSLESALAALLKEEQPQSQLLVPKVEVGEKPDVPPIEEFQARRRRRGIVSRLVVFLLVLFASAALYYHWPGESRRVQESERAETRVEGTTQPRVEGAGERPHREELAKQEEPAPAGTSGLGGETTPRTDQPPSVRGQQMPVTVKLTAVDTVWVEGRADGERVLMRTLQPGDQRELVAREIVSLVVGNAGGLQVNWNGQELGVLGRPGQVRRIEFGVEGYRFVQRQQEEQTEVAPQTPQEGTQEPAAPNVTGQTQ